MHASSSRIFSASSGNHQNHHNLVSTTCRTHAEAQGWRFSWDGTKHGTRFFEIAAPNPYVWRFVSSPLDFGQGQPPSPHYMRMTAPFPNTQHTKKKPLLLRQQSSRPVKTLVVRLPCCFVPLLCCFVACGCCSRPVLANMSFHPALRRLLLSVRQHSPLSLAPFCLSVCFLPVSALSIPPPSFRHACEVPCLSHHVVCALLGYTVGGPAYQPFLVFRLFSLLSSIRLAAHFVLNIRHNMHFPSLLCLFSIACTSPSQPSACRIRLLLCNYTGALNSAARTCLLLLCVHRAVIRALLVVFRDCCDLWRLHCWRDARV